MISRGFQMYVPVKTFVHDVVTIPKTPHTVKMRGRNGNWTNWPFADLAYLVKSGMLQAKVAHDPVTEVIFGTRRLVS